jgi:hypothetical protein
MSFKEKFKKWFKDFAEEGAAETMTEIAIDQLPPVLILSFDLLWLLAGGRSVWFCGLVFCYLACSLVHYKCHCRFCRRGVISGAHVCSLQVERSFAQRLSPP